MIFLVLLPASLSDLYCYKVPNAVICFGLSLSLLYRLWTAGITGLIPWLTGMAVPFFLCFILYLCRMAGAADIKLFSVIGSFYSVGFCLRVMAGSLIIAACMAICKLIYYRNGKERFHYLLQYLIRIMMTKRIEPYERKENLTEEYTIAFSIPISLAFMCCLIF